MSADAATPENFEAVPEGARESLTTLTLTCTVFGLENEPECAVAVMGADMGVTSVNLPVESIVAMSVRSIDHNTGVLAG